MSVFLRCPLQWTCGRGLGRKAWMLNESSSRPSGFRAGSRHAAIPVCQGCLPRRHGLFAPVWWQSAPNPRRARARTAAQGGSSQAFHVGCGGRFPGGPRKPAEERKTALPLKGNRSARSGEAARVRDRRYPRRAPRGGLRGGARPSRAGRSARGTAGWCASGRRGLRVPGARQAR